jgi:hypothetical protein
MRLPSARRWSPRKRAAWRSHQKVPVPVCILLAAPQGDGVVLYGAT